MEVFSRILDKPAHQITKEDILNVRLYFPNSNDNIESILTYEKIWKHPISILQLKIFPLYKTFPIYKLYSWISPWHLWNFFGSRNTYSFILAAKIKKFIPQASQIDLSKMPILEYLGQLGLNALEYQNFHLLASFPELGICLRISPVCKYMIANINQDDSYVLKMKRWCYEKGSLSVISDSSIVVIGMQRKGIRFGRPSTCTIPDYNGW